MVLAAVRSVLKQATQFLTRPTKPLPSAPPAKSGAQDYFEHAVDMVGRLVFGEASGAWRQAVGRWANTGLGTKPALIVSSAEEIKTTAALGSVGAFSKANWVGQLRSLLQTLRNLQLVELVQAGISNLENKEVSSSRDFFRQVRQRGVHSPAGEKALKELDKLAARYQNQALHEGDIAAMALAYPLGFPLLLSWIGQNILQLRPAASLERMQRTDALFANVAYGVCQLSPREFRALFLASSDEAAIANIQVELQQALKLGRGIYNSMVLEEFVEKIIADAAVTVAEFREALAMPDASVLHRRQLAPEERRQAHGVPGLSATPQPLAPLSGTPMQAQRLPPLTGAIHPEAAHALSPQTPNQPTRLAPLPGYQAQPSLGLGAITLTEREAQRLARDVRWRAQLISIDFFYRPSNPMGYDEMGATIFLPFFGLGLGLGSAFGSAAASEGAAVYLGRTAWAG